MAFWQSLVFTGSLIAGQEERRTQYLEAGLPNFPSEYPMTSGGEEWWKVRAEEEKRRWSMRPPSKRANWDSYGTKHPWMPPWKLICCQAFRSVTPTSKDTDVSKIQKKCHPWLADESVFGSTQIEVLRKSPNRAKMLARFSNLHRQQLDLAELDLEKAGELYDSCLIRVNLVPVNRASFADMAVIYPANVISEEDGTETSGDEATNKSAATSPVSLCTQYGH